MKNSRNIFRLHRQRKERDLVRLVFKINKDKICLRNIINFLFPFHLESIFLNEKNVLLIKKIILIVPFFDVRWLITWEKGIWLQQLKIMNDSSKNKGISCFLRMKYEDRKQNYAGTFQYWAVKFWNQNIFLENQFCVKHFNDEPILNRTHKIWGKSAEK